MVARSTYARAVIEAKILKLKQQEARLEAEKALRTATPGSPEAQAARDRLDGLKALQAAETQLADEQTSFASAITSAADDVRNMGDAFRRHDWAGVLSSLSNTLQTLQYAVGSSSGLGSVFGSLSTSLAQFAPVVAAGEAIISVLSTRSASIRSRKRTRNSLPDWRVAGRQVVEPRRRHRHDDRHRAPRASPAGKPRAPTPKDAAHSAAGQPILAGPAAAARRPASTLRQPPSSALDIGSRDRSRVVLSDGSEFRTNAVGDPAEAANAALLAVLKSANIVDETERHLIDSMIAAGKGFDDISATLAGYSAAQKVGASLADQILQLTDPQAFARKQVTDDIQTQRDVLKAALDAGYYTADQFAALNAQLSTLEGLQLDDVMKRFATSTDDATRGLKEWLEKLTGVTAASPGQSTAQAYAALQGAALASRAGDADATDKVGDLANAYLSAAKASASSQFEYAQAIAKARAIVSSVLLAAEARTNTDAPSSPTTSPTVSPAVPVVGGVDGTSPTWTGQVGTLTDEELAQIQAYIGSFSNGLFFATGGSFTVGGSGGDDSQLLSMALTPGEVVNISREDSMAGMANELASTRADLRAATTTLAGYSSAVKKLLDRWDGEGLPAERAS
jgi:hypothetical protein